MRLGSKGRDRNRDRKDPVLMMVNFVSSGIRGCFGVGYDQSDICLK